MHILIVNYTMYVYFVYNNYGNSYKNWYNKNNERIRWLKLNKYPLLLRFAIFYNTYSQQYVKTKLFLWKVNFVIWTTYYHIINVISIFVYWHCADNKYQIHNVNTNWQFKINNINYIDFHSGSIYYKIWLK